MNATNYRIRGFTGPNADFDFTVAEQPGFEDNFEAVADMVTAFLDINCGWSRAITVAASECPEERPDLRDVDSQRVYLFDDVESYDPENEGDDDHCERFMMVVDIAK